MATFDRTYVDTYNNRFSATSQDEIYRQVLYQLKEAYLTANWTLTLSCDGRQASDDGTDHWTTPEDITIGLNNGSSYFSYVALQHPSENAWVLITTDDSPGTPNSIALYHGSGAYELVPDVGDNRLQDRPTLVSGEERLLAGAPESIYPWNTNPPSTDLYSLRWFRVTSADGVMIFGTKRPTDGYVNFLQIHYFNTGAENPVNGFGDNRFFLYSYGSIGQEYPDWNNTNKLRQTTGFSMFSPTGTSLINSSMTSVHMAVLNLGPTTGTIGGLSLMAPIYAVNAGGVVGSARLLGQVKCLRSCLPLARPNMMDHNDTDDQVWCCVGGVIALPFTRSLHGRIE